MDRIALRKQLLGRCLDEVWSSGMVAACDRYGADEYTIFHDPGDPWEGKCLSREDFKARVSLSRAPFPDQRFDVQSMLGQGDEVAASWLWSATHLGDFPGFPATGQPVRMSGVTVYFFDDNDLICGHWQVCDRLSIFQQLQQNGTG